MADFNSKYSGEQVEQLLDQVASGGGGGVIDSCKVYVWEFDGTLANGSNGTISQEVADELSQAETVVLKMGDDSEGISMASSMVSVSGGALIIMFAQHLNDTLKQYYFVISGNMYNISEIDSPILTHEDWENTVKQDELYRGGDGDTLPRLQVKRGLIEDTETGFTYALPASSEESLSDADGIITTTDLAEQIARSIAYIEEEDGGSIVTRAKNGLFQVEVDGELGSIYAFPDIDEELKGEADRIIATNADVDRVDGKVYVWKPTSFVLNSTFSVSGDYFGIKNSKIVILDLGTARYISAPITIDASGNITLNFVSHTATGMQIITALIDTNQRCTTSASNVTFPTIDEKESWSAKQNKLVSGTNIKTVNGESILGSGNIAIEGGGGGTITGVSANGTSIATSGVANIPAASTSAYGVTKLTTATNSTSTTLAATASAVKSAYDLANSYKGTVTAVKVNGTSKSPSSGTVDIGNVVTSVKVNGSTYSPSSGVVNLGTISGSGSSGGVEKEFIELEGENEPLGYTGSFGLANPLKPNKVYLFTNPLLSLYINEIEEQGAIGDEYTIIFEAFTPTMVLGIQGITCWANGTIPTIESGCVYELSLLRIHDIFQAVLTPFKFVE